MIIIPYQGDLDAGEAVSFHPSHLHFIHILSFVDQQPADGQGQQLAGFDFLDSRQHDVREVHRAFGCEGVLVGDIDRLDAWVRKDWRSDPCLCTIDVFDDILERRFDRMLGHASAQYRHPFSV